MEDGEKLDEKDGLDNLIAVGFRVAIKFPGSIESSNGER